MSEKISIHDNLLQAYTIDCAKREIRLHTVCDSDPNELTDVVFTGVAAYHFDGDNFATVIFSVDEVLAEEVLDSSRALFDEGREYCWPGTWNTSREAVLEYVRKRSLKAFRIHSSYGMSGWVLAETMTIKAGGGTANTAKQ